MLHFHFSVPPDIAKHSFLSPPRTAPCLPGNVMAQLDCNVNNLAVQWNRSQNITDSYTALAISRDGTRLSCNTSSTSCTIQNLRCGRIYSIVVTTSSVSCGVIEGSDYHIQTGKQQFRPEIKIKITIYYSCL